MMAQLKEENEMLKSQNRKAAQLALQIIEEKNHLTKDNDRLKKQQCGVECENLRQDNYTLTNNLDSKTRLLGEYNDELEKVNKSLKELEMTTAEKFQSYAGIENRQNIMQKKYDDALCELNETKNINQQLIVERNELKVEIARTQRRARLSDDSLENSRQNRSHELLKEDIVHLTEENETLLEELKLMTDLQLNTKSQCQMLTRQLEGESSRADEFTKLCSQYRTEIEDCKEQLVGLKSDLECAHGQQKTARKGNSMFGELDEHRLKLERELLLLKENNDQLIMTNDKLEQKFESQQQQLVIALQLSSGQVNAKALEDEVTRLRGELRVAGVRLSRHELTPMLEGAFLADTDRLSQDLVASLRMEIAHLKRDQVRTSRELDTFRDSLILQQQQNRQLNDKLVLSEHECVALRRKFGVDLSIASRAQAISIGCVETLMNGKNHENNEYILANPEQNAVSEKPPIHSQIDDPESASTGKLTVRFVESNEHMKNDHLKENEPRRRRGRKVENVREMVADSAMDTSTGQCKQQ